MTTKGFFRGLVAVAGFLLTAALAAGQESQDRNGYSYIRAMTGEATVASRLNGTVDARRNMPISVGDELSVSQAGRVEIAMADGNVLFVGGGSRISFESLSDQQGEQDPFSAVRLTEGELVLSGLGSSEEQIPRVDTDDATVYLSAGSHVRVNSDPRRGTVVIGRAGSVEVRTRSGSHTLAAGQYMMARADEEPEIARGAFSRDRFDLWVADRLETLDETPRSASVRYVGDQYAGDVAALDGYGDWEYDSSYGGQVWSPRVDEDWSPYSYGSWYYTNAGLTWWPYDPWGWYPFHYGNWFFARNHWCWAPGYAYSPAWVYWGYTSGYVGWCPIGYYSFFSPWWDTYYRRLGFQPRTSLYFALNGTFPTRRVDFRGWNFTGAGSFGATAARASVIPGSRIGDRLGSQVAISSRPIVVSPREGGVREAIRTYVREAPRSIERTAGTDSERLAPVLARERTLPADTVAALRERAVVADRGRLSGPAAAELAPRGAIVDRSRIPSSGSSPVGREPGILDRRGAAAPEAAIRDRAISSDRSSVRVAPRATSEDWRGRGTPRGTAPDAILRDREAAGDRSSPRAVTRESSEDAWRGRANPRAGEGRDIGPRDRTVAPERPSLSPPGAARSESWRFRSDVPPAQRVIEGAVPGRRAPEARSESWRGRDLRVERPPAEQRGPTAAPAPRSWMRSPDLPRSRAEREFAPAPAPPSRVDRAPYSPPSPRVDRAPYSYSPPPPRVDRAPYSPPPARFDRAPAPAPAPRAEPRAEPRHESRERSAPAPHPERGRPSR